MNNIALKPRVSEKAYALAENLNTYVFVVPKTANKHSVAKSVASQFKVSVLSVRMASTPGKSKRVFKKRGRAISGQSSDVRKAYVTLKEGDKLPIFSAEDEAPKKKDTK